MSLEREIGRVLRRAREARGLTLRQASEASGRRFPPTSLASYERGERAISVARFVRLAGVYRMPPERLMADISRAIEGATAPTIDVAALASVGSQEAEIVAEFIHEVARLRDEDLGDVVALRRGDLEILASASGRPAPELIDAIRRAVTGS